MPPSHTIPDNTFLYSSIFFLVAVILVALFFIFAFTEAGRLVVDSTRVGLRSLTNREGRIKLPDDALETRSGYQDTDENEAQTHITSESRSNREAGA